MLAVSAGNKLFYLSLLDIWWCGAAVRFTTAKAYVVHALAMTTTMVQSVMLAGLVSVFLVSYGAQSLKPEDGASLRSGAVDLPWQDELCCESPSAHLGVEGGSANSPEANLSQSNLPHSPGCTFKSSRIDSHHPRSSGGTCLDVLCRIDGNWRNLICDLRSRGQPSDSLMAVSLRRQLFQQDGDYPASENPVVCEAQDSFMCSLTLDPTTSFVAMVTVSISDAVAPPVLLRVPARPEKPSPPGNLSHTQTIEGELIVLWDDPADFDAGPLRYEVRYSSGTTHPASQVVSAPGEPRVSLDLKPKLNYTVQVRCSGPEEPPLWSEWSEPHHIRLDTVSYIPKKVVARPGENVTVYCVFNDHRMNASMAVWKLNFQPLPPPTLYHPVNQWVSKITLHPSENQMYDLLRCTEEWSIPYSQIFVEGADIDIKCVTNGDIDAMDCSWTHKQPDKLRFQSKWADLPCDEMEERERAGENLGEMSPACMEGRQKTCTIHPLRMNCYKLWLELPSQLGPIRSKPVYLSPVDHVKPHAPANVKAVSHSSGVLEVTWQAPPLPVDGLQFQFQYYSPSTVSPQPKWKLQDPVRVLWAEVAVPDMCRVYVVQVRCKHTNGTGYWSDWSESVYSTPQNSRAPEHGPDFWRIRQDDPHGNQSNITLLFENFPPSGNSYCVDGFKVQHQSSNGSVLREIELTSSYSFDWNQELQTVTVEAYNSLGTSTDNINMTLERQPKGRCVRSFHVLLINSTCVSLSWSLLENSLVPLFMVVEWLPHKQQDSGPKAETWARLRYTDYPVYLRGDFFASEEYGFFLYPVFAEGEGEPIYTLATRGDPEAYMMLMIISFLFIILFVTLVLSQNQMKKFVWKDVPNPRKCSWAKGIDFKKVDTFDYLFRPQEGLPVWPLLMPSENISQVIIVDKVLTTALIQNPLPDPADALAGSHSPGFDLNVDQFMENETLPVEGPSSAVLDMLTTSRPRADDLQPADPSVDQHPGSTDNSGQSSVIYTAVLVSNPSQDQEPPIHLPYKNGSGNSSSDEGNFSANNSDISGSFPGGLWELESCRGLEMDDPRRSCSNNSVEELSQTSEDEHDVRREKDLYYLGMDYPAEDEESEKDDEQSEDEDAKVELLKSTTLNRGHCSVELHPLLGQDNPSEPGILPSPSTCGFAMPYLPQFRTATCTVQHTQLEPSCD
ncbi:leptin receptor isoform X1 [Neolamprologus brichardi]|uniref:leptin receptor isoform X1 n=2 Tax=Neolamprologus brichardi TaxID=32507 RepID=UPI001643EA0C|nr:leptin receptor isoform X1 [Neolamprologus brichardi]